MIAHPAVFSLSHIFSREDLFLVVFCLVDDWMHQHYGASNLPRRRGPVPETVADSEVLTIVLVGELCQVKRERAWLRQVRASYRALFPHLPEDSRFARRATSLRGKRRLFATFRQPAEGGRLRMVGSVGARRLSGNAAASLDRVGPGQQCVHRVGVLPVKVG